MLARKLHLRTTCISKSVQLTDAVAKPSRERNEGIRMSTDGILWQEALGSEFFRVREEARVSVEGVSHDYGICSFGDSVTI